MLIVQVNLKREPSAFDGEWVSRSVENKNISVVTCARTRAAGGL